MSLPPRTLAGTFSAAKPMLLGPGLLAIGHLLGGASGPLESTLLTLTIALIGAYGFWRGRLGMNMAYWRDLRAPAVAFVVLLVLGLSSLLPGSDQFASGWISERAGRDTLSIDPEATWIEIVKLAGLGIMFILAYRHASTADELKQTLRGLVWLTVVWAIWALILYAASARSGDGIARLAGTFVSPNVAACVLSIGLLCWMTLVDRTLKSRRTLSRVKLLTASAAGVILSGTLLLTASRSAIVIMAVLATLWVSRRVWTWVNGESPNKGQRRVVTGVALACLAAGAYSASAFLARLGTVGEELTSRSIIMTTYAGAASESLLLGHGLGTVPRISRLLLTPENDAVMWNVRAAHNLPLQWTIEMGVVGVLIAVVVGGWLLLGSGRRLTRETRLTMLPLFMVSAFMLLQGMVDYPAQIYSVALTWAFIVGLVYRASTSWAGKDKAVASRGRRRHKGASPHEAKHDNQTALRRELLGNRAGRVVRHG